MKLYRTTAGPVLSEDSEARLLADLDWDDIFRAEYPAGLLADHFRSASPTSEPREEAIQAPIQSQEVWAAGVTYYRSRTARMDESKAAGGASFYDHVYSAERPELFFKSTPHRVAAPLKPVRIRKDSRWNVPEPELTAAINSAGRIFGWTIGNDMSSRDIEGENPLYLPQAKVYAGSAALGPCILIGRQPPPDTEIHLQIERASQIVFEGSTKLSQLKRDPQYLADYLFRDNAFPAGCFLMTGTGIVPPDTFTLAVGDLVRITIEPIGVLSNSVE